MFHVGPTFLSIIAGTHGYSTYLRPLLHFNLYLIKSRTNKIATRHAEAHRSYTVYQLAEFMEHTIYF